MIISIFLVDPVEEEIEPPPSLVIHLVVYKASAPLDRLYKTDFPLSSLNVILHTWMSYIWQLR